MFLFKLLRSRLFGKLIFFLVSITGIFLVLVFFSSPAKSKASLGTWWWDKNLNMDDYITFASKNNVTEIYYCNYNLDSNFVNLAQKAKKKNIKTYLLAGEKEWLLDRAGLDTLIEKYVQFQNDNNNILAGVHLDIEPHQFDDFEANRTTYLLKLVELIKTNKTTHPDICFDYDIPFWLDDQITFDGKTKETYKFVLDYANRTFVMSYRDTAEKMIDVSKEEIAYAKQNKKTLFLCAETYSTEGDNVSFMEEGKEYMMTEINKVRKEIPSDFGIAIHNIKTWKNLKNK